MLNFIEKYVILISYCSPDLLTFIILTRSLSFSKIIYLFIAILDFRQINKSMYLLEHTNLGTKILVVLILICFNIKETKLIN